MGIYKLRTEFATHLKVLLWIVFSIFAVGAVWQFGAAPVINTQKKKDVVIKVAGAEIQRNDFDSEWQNAYEIVSQKGLKSPLQFANVKQMLVDNMINSQKLLMVAKDEGIQITKKDVKAAKDEKIVESLKQNRTAIMGLLSSDEEKIDPRKDKKYLKTLSENGMSVDNIIKEATANISDLTIKAELAQKQIMAKIDAKAKALTNTDVENTYNNYALSQIVIDTTKTTPEKAEETANTAIKELKGGADFNAVKAKYSSIKDASVKIEYNSIDMPWMLPPAVAEKVEGLSVGDYTEPIKDDKAIYIVKVDQITNKKPANLDEKAISARKDQIKQSLQQKAFTSIQTKMEAIKDVTIIDPEFAGYYHCSLAEKETNPEKAKAEYNIAINEFTKALKKEANAGKDVITAKLAFVYNETGKYKEACDTLYNLLDGPNSTTEASDLRMLYGDSLLRMGDKVKALKQYEDAAMLNKTDSDFQTQLATRFDELGKADLASAARQKAGQIKAWEQKQQADMMKQMQVQTEKSKSPESKPKK